MQAAFRGFQVRKQYCKILWSVGVIEKVILRWRLKRKGLRGLQVNSVETAVNQLQESDAEEDFYQTSRKQAEERVERSVVCIQAMFRSKKAQQEYRRMKLTHKQAKVCLVLTFTNISVQFLQIANHVKFVSCSYTMKACLILILTWIVDEMSSL